MLRAWNAFQSSFLDSSNCRIHFAWDLNPLEMIGLPDISRLLKDRTPMLRLVCQNTESDFLQWAQELMELGDCRRLNNCSNGQKMADKSLGSKYFLQQAKGSDGIFAPMGTRVWRILNICSNGHQSLVELGDCRLHDLSERFVLLAGNLKNYSGFFLH